MRLLLIFLIVPFISLSQSLTIQNGGSLTGEPGSEISAEITNLGVVKPSSFELNGNFIQSSNGTYKSTITNGADATDITVNGNIALDGALEVDEQTNGPSAIEDIYVLINYTGTLSGTFSSISLPPAYAAYSVDYGNYQAGAVVIGLSSLLPIKLISFTAEKIEENVILDWKTSSEQNNLGFNIQHSNNGIDWQNIGWVDGIGNSQVEQQYNFIHENPITGDNFYRLEQVDVDNSTDYSPIEKVIFGEVETNGKFFIYPNPVYNEFNINLPMEFNIIEVRIFDAKGILRKNINFQNGDVISVNELESGFYFIQIDDGENNQLTTTFIKQ